mmetsp:Transcript_6093/g.18873  ORF Transcript_6093/g.18873 Transcript_6093/m.18873 type:complete len:102 (+) Transcript_6093:2106-2411(+)|eukprot:365412-Chlamydomonas_euryale.AAC.7
MQDELCYAAAAPSAVCSQALRHPHQGERLRAERLHGAGVEHIRLQGGELCQARCRCHQAATAGVCTARNCRACALGGWGDAVCAYTDVASTGGGNISCVSS